MRQQSARTVFGRKPLHNHAIEPSLLIVEDEELLAEYMERLAESLGWRAESAGSVKAVQHVLQDHHPAVLVLDLSLPDGDGVELLRSLADRGYEGAILIVSSCGDDILESCGRLADCLGLRVAGWARKPIGAARFSELLEQSRPPARH